MRVSSPPGSTISLGATLTLPSPFPHSFALTGAGASVSPKRERAKERLDVQFNQLAVWIISYLIEVI